MNLANPTSLLWLALAIPIIVFYVLKIRLRRVPVSTTLFWRRIFEEKQARSLWQYLRHLLSLLLQLLLLGFLVFALAEPFFQWEILEARRLVLILDNSASMNAGDVSPSRLEKARAHGRDVLARLRHRDEAAIVSAGSRPQVVCGMTGHVRTLQDALADVPASDGPTHVADAVTLARRLLAGHERGQIVVLTDGCFDGVERLGQADDVQLWVVGRRTGNVGITRFQARRSLVDPVGYEILVEVHNQSDEAVECRLEVDLEDRPIDVVPLKLAANDRWLQVFPKASAQGGRLTARLDRDDALLADNRAIASLPRRESQPVLLVAEANLFLTKVFEANPLVKLTSHRPAADAPLPVGPAEGVTVYHREVPPRLPPGKILVVDPARDCDLWRVGATLTNPIVTKQDRDSPLMAHVRLDNVLMPEARKLTFAEGATPQILAASVTGDPLYAAFERPEGKVLVLTVNLDKGDLPLRTAFPILASNALAWFAGASGELREALATGAIVEAELPPDKMHVGGLGLWSPDGRRHALPDGVSRFTVGPLDQCGAWTIAPTSPEGGPGEPVLEFTCNLANARESDVRAFEQPDPIREGNRLALMAATRPIWFYLVAAGLLLAGVEWYLYQRRWIS